MKTVKTEYEKPSSLVMEFINQSGFMVDIYSEGTGGQMGNEASVKPFEDEEDENEARRNHEVWDDEE